MFGGATFGGTYFGEVGGPNAYTTDLNVTVQISNTVSHAETISGANTLQISETLAGALAAQVVLTDTVNISGTPVRIFTGSRALTDTISISNAVARTVARVISRTPTLSISDTVARRVADHRITLTDLLNISNVVHVPKFAFPDDEVDISAELTVTSVFVQFDTWRPVTSPENSLVLVCRTPQGDHDTDLTSLELWTLRTPNGTFERKAIGAPADNGYGWDSYAHPEWSPNGQFIVVAAETATEYKLALLAASGFGTI